MAEGRAFEGRCDILGQVIALGISGEGVFFHITAVAINRGPDQSSCVAILADELCRGAEAEIDEVVEDEDLTIAVRSGADANGGDTNLGGDASRDFPRHTFEDQQDSPSSFEGVRVMKEGIDGGNGLALHFIAAHFVDGLGREPEVADDRDLGGGEPLDQFGAAGTALDFDGLGAGLFDKADGVGHALSELEMVRAPGHVGGNDGVTHGPADGASVVQHFLDRDGQSVFVAEDHLGEGIADQDQVDAGLVDQARRSVVIGSERRDGSAGVFLLL